MKALREFLRRAWLPAAAFIGVGVIHFLWHGLFPESNPAQDRWVAVPQAENVSWLTGYVESGRYWLGYCYALSLAFAVTAIRRYFQCRSARARNFAAGGITLFGVLAAVGCFLLGCCGSPMLGVYVSLLGARFLPLAGPLVAGMTTVFIGASYWWMIRRIPSDLAGADPSSCRIEDRCSGCSWVRVGGWGVVTPL